MGISRRDKSRDDVRLASETPLAREAAACGANPERSRAELYRLLLRETVYLRTKGPVTGTAGWHQLSVKQEVGFVSLQSPEGGEYLPIYDHPLKLKAAARRLGVEGPIHYLGLRGDAFWNLKHPSAITGVLLNPGRPGTIMIGRFDMDVLATGICPGDLERAITAGEPMEALLQNHPLLVPCGPDGTADIETGADGRRRMHAFSSTDAFAAYLSRRRPTHVVCKPGRVCVKEAARTRCLLVLNPEGPATCSLNPLVVSNAP